MIERFSELIVNGQIKKGTIKEQERLLYQYGYEVMLNQIINILISAVIASIFHAPFTVLCFLICYIPLRSFCGGYHAKTHGRCTFFSTVLLLMACILTKTTAIHNTLLFMAVSAVISGASVFILAPVEDRNKPLEEIEVLHYRKTGRIIWLIEAVIGFVLFFINKEVGFVISVTHLLFTSMLWLGMIKNKKNPALVD